MSRIAKTHYDHTASWRPTMIRQINQRVQNLPDDEPLHIEAAIDKEAEDLITSFLVDSGRQNLPASGYPTRMMSDSDILRAIPQDIHDRIWYSIQQEYFNALNFTLFGRKTFFFTHSLVTRLAETELNVDVELLKLPFKSCVFAFGDQITRQALYAIEGKTAPDSGLVTVYITQFPQVYGGSLYIYAAHETDLAIGRTLKLQAGDRLEDAIRTDWLASSDRPKSTNPFAKDDESAFYGPGLRFFRILLNAILYLGSSDPDVSGLIAGASSAQNRGISGKARRQLDQRTARETRLDYIHVGRSVIPFEDAPLTSSPGRTLNQRLKVRGHWKPQAHGPNWTLRKLIHIEPYWRGPDAAEVIERPYLVR